MSGKVKIFPKTSQIFSQVLFCASWAAAKDFSVGPVVGPVVGEVAAAGEGATFFVAKVAGEGVDESLAGMPGGPLSIRSLGLAD